MGIAALTFHTSITAEQFPALNVPVRVAEMIVPAKGAVKDGVVPVPTAVPAAALLPKVMLVIETLATNDELGTVPLLISEPAILLFVSVCVSVVPTMVPAGAATEDVTVVAVAAIGIWVAVMPDKPLEPPDPFAAAVIDPSAATVILALV